MQTKALQKRSNQSMLIVWPLSVVDWITLSGWRQRCWKVHVIEDFIGRFGTEKGISICSPSFKNRIFCPASYRYVGIGLNRGTVHAETLPWSTYRRISEKSGPIRGQWRHGGIATAFHVFRWSKVPSRVCCDGLQQA